MPNPNDNDENLGKDDDSSSNGAGPSGKRGDAQQNERARIKSPPHKCLRVEIKSTKGRATECGLDFGGSFGQPLPVCHLSFGKIFVSLLPCAGYP